MRWCAALLFGRTPQDRRASPIETSGPSGRVLYCVRCASLSGIVLGGSSLFGCSMTEPMIDESSDAMPRAADVVIDDTRVKPWSISFAPTPQDLSVLLSGTQEVIVVPESDLEYQEQAIAAIDKALCKYSPSLKQLQNLEIFCVASLKIGDKEVGATNSKTRDVILIRVRDSEEQLDPARLEQILHHEFSSLLVRQHLDVFPAQLWQATLPHGFEYTQQEPSDYVEARPGGDVEWQDLENGFLGKYAQVDPMQDINTVAEQVMMESSRYALAIRTFPRLRQKAFVYALFLTHVDPALGERAMAFVQTATDEHTDNSDG